MFSSVLIANRGEIALRVIESARAEGYKTIAVFSDADAAAPHVLAADIAVPLGAAPVGESYLNMDKIFDAAKRSGADAIHPGYGFFSENADFARRCAQAELCFIGPSPAAIELMGSKRLSKLAMIEAGVPTIPGYDGAEQSDEVLLDAAQQIGFPLMIKASAGGGGRGMRLVHSLEEARQQIGSARSEAQNAFGSGELILERALLGARHIEVQVFADRQGNCIHLGERDCSIQRRHQKIIEEAPSPFVSPALRSQMGACAVQAASSCGYSGAGTVEFLVDGEQNFYFLEMNTRLQVEHPVTELISGQDLVGWQLQVAAGDPLPLTQQQVELSGHAIEVRLYAEDCQQGFLPQTGNIQRWLPAEGPGVRIDAGIACGNTVSPYYDPMLAKIIAHGSTREQARRRLLNALQRCELFGVTTNQNYLCGILGDADFISGHATTAFIENYQPRAFAEDELATALAASVIYRALSPPLTAALHSWRSANPAPCPLILSSAEQAIELMLACDDGRRFTVDLPDGSQQLTLLEHSQTTLRFEHEGLIRKASYTLHGNSLRLKIGSAYYAFENITQAPPSSSGGEGSGQIKAPMDGVIVELLVKPGDKVCKGQTLAVLEAMKMEHQLKAEIDGEVAAVNASPGEQVKIRQTLIQLTDGQQTQTEK